ncbi:MAG TPA: type IX secretion system sortase PorU [Bacteroidota bacterium]|nr:type IX secretion system sortase PorU [Bacteroidota bacterium]
MKVKTSIGRLALVFLVASGVRAHAAGNSAPAGVRVVRSDNRSFVFEYRPVYTSPRVIDAGGQTFTAFDFAGAGPFDPHPRTGAPDLACRRFAVSLPSTQGNAVQVVAADYEDVPGTTLPPVPKDKVENGMFGAPVYQMDSKAYGVSTFLPGQVVSLSTPSRVRSLLVSTVTVAPVQFNPATRTVRRYTRIVVQVDYGTSAGGTATGQDAQLVGPGLLNGAVPATAVRLARTASLNSSVLSSGKWLRLSVNADGVYKLDAAYLSAAGIDVSGVDPRTIKIYGNGGQELSEDITQGRPTDLVENAIYVQGESDGKFDTGDYILFYGKSVRGWTYDPVGKTMHHYINHYSETNYYWLTYGGATGKRMATEQSDSDPPTYSPDRFRDHLAVEEENVKLLNPVENVLSGKDWYAHILDDKNPTFTYAEPMPGLVPGDAINYRFALLAYPPNGGASFDVLESGVSLGRFYVSGVVYSIYTYAYETTSDASGSSSLSSNTSRLVFSFNLAGSGSQGYIDWVEWDYPRFFFANGNYLHFWGPDRTDVVQYQLQQFTEQPMIFDVSSPSNVKVIGGVYGTYSFRAPSTAGAVQEFVAAGPSTYKQPAAVQAVTNQDLHGFADGADYIIITSSDFVSAANRLAGWRQQAAHGNLKTIVTDVSQIYNEFAGGIPDITAIRDYLYYDYTNWTRKPQFVLLFGGASYDYKGILGKKTSFVPTWQSANSVDGVDSYSTDDYFAMFSSTATNPSIVLGRIPSRDLADANTVVDKVMRYETQSVADGWKMRATYVADDSWTSEGGDFADLTIHADAAESLSSSNYTPDEFEKKKIYIAEYPTVYDALGRRKPGAYQAIIDQINQGTLILNYTGHGNPQQWAHENIFNTLTSIPQLLNTNRLTLYFLATCNFSQFDDPSQVSGGELLVNKPDGGGIAVISACRKVYASSNAELNYGTYHAMFTHDAYNRVQVERPATALFQYKQRGNLENDQKYFFLGDPTLRLQYPSGYASVDSINRLSVDSTNTLARTSPIAIQSLSTVTVAGSMRDASDDVDSTFNGQMILFVNDASRVQTIINFYPGRNWSYTATGSTIFRGDNTVARGRFHATFVVPKDIFFGDSTGRGRMVAYCTNSTSDAEGYTGNIAFSGTDSVSTHDNAGPAITIYLNSRTFRQGDLVGPNPVLLADLADSNGINTSASGIGHRIEAWLNNSAQSVDLTDAYTSTINNYRQGTVQYQLSSLPVGKNTLRIRAWDSFNNSSTVETEFQVASDENLVITDVMNFPNPFSAGITYFTFHQNQQTPLNVRIKVYTVAGRMIKSIESTTGGESFVKIPWDGRDADGDGIANGVYLYKVVASTVDGKFTSEALGKLAIVK